MSEKNKQFDINRITYGSIIALALQDDESQFVFSDGHVKSQILIQHFDLQGKDEDDNKNKQQGKIDNKSKNKTKKKVVKTGRRMASATSGRDSIQACLFQIYPSVSNTVKEQVIKELRAAQGEINDIPVEDKNNKKSIMHREGVKRLEKEKVLDYQNRLLNEYKYNQDAMEKQRGQTIYYNQVIQLMHVESTKFLACHDEESHLEKENYLITLDEYSSDATMFKILPAFKYQMDGDMVVYADEIISIVGAKAFLNKVTYLHASSEININERHQNVMRSITTAFNINESQAQQGKGQQQQSSQSVGKLPNFKREINASMEEPGQFQIKLFTDACNSSESGMYLKCGDVVWLHHSEANASLSATRRSRGVDKYNFSSLNLDTWLNESNLDINIVQSQMNASFDEYNGNTFGMWTIENQKPLNGGFVEFTQKYRLRHISSGCYLCVNTLSQKQRLETMAQENQAEFLSNENGKQEFLKLSMTTSMDQSTLFQFFPLNTSSSIHDKYIRPGSFVYVYNKQSEKWVDVVNTSGLTQHGGSNSGGSESQQQIQKSLTFQAELKKEQSENQVFKLYQATNQEVWEVNFLISCFQILISFLRKVMQITQQKRSRPDESIFRVMKNKINRIRKCVIEINEFCNNRLGNSQQDEKFGQTNTKRQKLLREQYFIDLLVKILEESFIKSELDLYNQRQKINRQEEEQNLLDARQGVYQQSTLAVSQIQGDNRQKSKSFAGNNKSLYNPLLDNKDYINYLNQKVEFCCIVYRLLVSICRNNPENQIYTFQLVAFFQIHCKYIPEAIYSCIDMFCQNEQILTDLSKDLHIDYDYNQSNDTTNIDQRHTNVIKFLINLYDEDIDGGNNFQIQKQNKTLKNNFGGGEDKIQFRQHDKITSKPVNLIIFFMNLIWDQDAILQSDYLRFLRYICSYKSIRGMALNQENVYKLFRKYNSVRSQIRFDEYFKSGALKVPENPDDLSEIQVCEQLMFFAGLSFGRNFLWRKELIPHFSNHYLLENIWNKGLLKRWAALRSSFIKLAMSLYINHDPLNVRAMPNFCRLYRNVDILEDVKVFKEENNQGNEINMYSSLIDNMMEYFRDTVNNIEKVIENTFKAIEVNGEKELLKLGYRAENLLSELLILNSIELMQLLLDMNLFAALDKIHYYQQIVAQLITIFQYDYTNIVFVMALFKSEHTSINKAVTDKKSNKTLINPLNMMNFNQLNIFAQKKEEEIIEDEEDDDQPEGQNLDEALLFKQPLMRGFNRLNNQLEAVYYEDYAVKQTEIQIKLNICRILEQFLDRRQDYLLSNFLAFFKHRMVAVKDEDQKEFEEIIKEFCKNLLPNIQKTGFKEVDDIYKPKEEVQQNNLMPIPINLNLNFLQDKKKPGFNKFIKVPGFEESGQLDELFSMAYENTNTIDGDPAASPLPTLICNFLIIEDQELEKKCLSLLMRMYNQRQEFIDNLQKFQVIFDDEKDNLYTFIRNQTYRLRKLVEQSEVWFSNFIRYRQSNQQDTINNSGNDQQGEIGQNASNVAATAETATILECLQILKSMKKGFFSGLTFTQNDIILPENNSQRIDPNKQLIHKYIQSYLPVIDLLKDTMHHFESAILDENVSTEQKTILSDLFSTAYDFLTNFTQNNPQNQIIMYEYFDLFIRYLKYDLHQTKLICAIFKNNPTLLVQKVDKDFIQRFSYLILTEGRQDHALDIFITVMRCSNKYLFDNQLLVMNTFLPSKDITEDQSKLLYVDGSRKQDIRFYLEEPTNLEEISLIQKLAMVGFRDTYCDQPFRYHTKLMQMLLETSRMQVLSPWERESMLDNELKESFNITVAKLKKTFKLNYLLEILNVDDSFLESQLAANGGGPQSSAKKKQSARVAFNIQDQQQQQRVSSITEESNKNNNNNNASVVDEAMLLKQREGYSMLKPIVLDFIRCVHIISEKATANCEAMHQQKELATFIDLETMRLEKLLKDQFKKNYTEYIFSHLIPLLISYYTKFLDPQSGVLGQVIEDEERKDDKALHDFAVALQSKLPLFQQCSFVLKRQIRRANLFIKLILSQDGNQQGANGEEEANGGTIIAGQPPILDNNEINLVDKISGGGGALAKGGTTQVLQSNKVFVTNKEDQQQLQQIQEGNQEEEIASPAEGEQPLVKQKKTVAVAQNLKLNLSGIINKQKQQTQTPNKKDQIVIGGEEEEEQGLEEDAAEGEIVQPPPAQKAELLKNQVTKSPQKQVVVKTSKQRTLSSMFSFGKKKEEKPPVRQIDQQNMNQVEKFWKEWIHQFTTSKIVEKEVELEKQAFSDAVTKIKNIIQGPEENGNLPYNKIIRPIPDIKLLMKKFISFLEQSIGDKANKQTTITLLTILRKIIEKEEDELKRQVIQNQFDKLGAMKMVLKVLSGDDTNMDSQLLINFLLFANIMLEGGNQRVQNTIFEFVTTYSKSEVLFFKFNQIIRRQIEYIELQSKEKAAGMSHHNADGGLPQGNSNGGQQGGNSEDGSGDHGMDIEILNQVLSFLQLCVEGHYLSLQNYLRQQTNSRNNYDMINAVADLLKTYYYHARYQKMYGNMIQCLDTLSEFVQGPCPQNQVAVSESKFFDIAFDLFSKKEKLQASNKKQLNALAAKGGHQITAKEKFKAYAATAAFTAGLMNKVDEENKGDRDLESWMISRLQNKCLILILSLLEMRDVKENNSIIKRIMRTLPINVLERHIVKVYKKFFNIYKGEYRLESLSHQELDPLEMDPADFKKKHHFYFETIIQNGFYMFFLISYYMDADDTVEGAIVSMFKQQRKRVLKEEVGGLESLLFGDNIIGQLIQFAMQIIKQSLGYAQQLKEMTVDKIKITGDEDNEEERQKKARLKAEQKKKMLKKAFTFFSENSAHIDVVRNEQLEIVYFILLPYAHCLPKEKKTAFHEDVDRSNTKSKVQDLIKESESLIQICKHELWLKEFFAQNKFLALFANYVKLWKDLAFNFTLIINIIIFFSFGEQYGDRMNNFEFFNLNESETRQLFFIFGFIIIVCSNFVLLFFLFKNVPLIVQRAWKESPEDEKKQRGFFSKIFNWTMKFFKVLFSFLEEIEVLYYIAYGTLAIMGLVLHPFCFTFHLTEIMMRYPTLKNVLRSIYEPRQQLFITFVLLLVLEYMASITIYMLFSDNFGGNCESTLYCFLIAFDQTFKGNAGMANLLTDNSPSNNIAGYKLSRFFFDQITCYILNIILINIVAGIIIDTFGSLREKENAKLEDIEDKCFICGNLRTTFDRKSDQGSGFQQHIKINHYMWNYVFFIAYLDWKDKNDYTGIESFVTERLQEKDSSWFPFNKARELEDLKEDDEGKDLKQFESFQKELLQINSSIGEITKMIEKSSKKK